MAKYSKYIQIPANILLFLAIIFFIIALFGKRMEGEAYIGEFGTLTFNENWVIRGENESQEIYLPVVLDTDKGDTIILENVLPSYVDNGMRLCMRSALQDIYFYIDGKLRGCYASENFEYVGEYLPSSYVMVDLEKEDAGKPICIQITTKAQGKLNEVRIGYGNNVWFSILYHNLPVVVAALILIIIGILAVLAHFLMRKVINSSKAVLFLGQAMIVIGLWIISESHVRQLIFRSPSYSFIFAYIFIELIGGFVALYFDEIQKHKYHKAYVIVEILTFGQAAVNTILALSGLVEFYTTLVFAHIWMLVGVVTFIATVIIDIKTKRMKEYSITAFGMLIFVLFCIFEIVGFYFKDFYVLGVYLCIGLIILLVTTIIQSITEEFEKIKMTAQLEKEKVEAENVNLAKSQSLAIMSHEIRTPINAVIGMNEMILRESREDNIRKYASDVKDSSAVLLNIINEILDASKIESGKMEIVPVNYEIGSLLNDLYNMLSIKAKDKGLELVFDIDSSIPNEYFGDDKRLRQVLLNLLTNAVKYTNQGQVVLKVTCKVEGENAILHYCVKDTGIGIKEEDIEKIYAAFERVDLQRNREVEGTGLGMTIVQQLLRLMGSEIRIQSEYEKGSEFSFDITQKIVNREPLGDFRGKLSEANKESGQRTVYTAPEAKILVVDDYKMNLKVFKGLLKQTQIQIYEAESGQECLDMVKKESFDLIFLDHMMPEMDGIETLHEIRSRKLCEGVPIIMLTANAIIGDKEKYLREGFDDFLTKPIIPDKLDKMILRYLPAELVNREGNVAQSPWEPEEVSILDKLCKRLPEIHFESGLATCGGDEDFYLELLEDFTNLAIKEELTKYLSEADYKNYCIRIHGFKNSAYSIGAKEMGDLAYEMEKLTRESLPEEIKVMQSSLFGQYDRICLKYNEVIKRNG